MNKLNALDIKDRIMQNEAKTIYVMLKRQGRLVNGTYQATSANSTDPVGLTGEAITYTIEDTSIHVVYLESGATDSYVDDGSEDHSILDESLKQPVYPPGDRYSPLPEFEL